MNTDFKNELDRSYLILDDIEEASEFIIHMLSENEIHGLLETGKRSFNGSARMYYEISGMQTLETLSQTRLLGEKDLQTFFEDLLLVLEELTSFFLNPAGLLLDFKHIYVGQEGYRFCYYPILGEPIEKKMADFAEEMLGYVDHNNEKAVVMAYQFYRLVKEENRMARQILHDMLDGSRQEEPAEDAAEKEELVGKESAPLWEEEAARREQESEIKIAAVLKEDPFSVGIFFLLFLCSLGYFGYAFYKAGLLTADMIFGTKNGIIMFAFLVLSIIGESVSLFINYRKITQSLSLLHH